MSECLFCHMTIDPNTCHCGDPVDTHTISSGHAPIPLGCICYYADEELEEKKDHE
jgi:hypothetical protein